MCAPAYIYLVSPSDRLAMPLFRYWISMLIRLININIWFKFIFILFIPLIDINVTSISKYYLTVIMLQCLLFCYILHALYNFGTLVII